MSTVAIVMATYNGERYVGEQIDSILASTYQDFELFIYDDGSKDNTMSILHEYEQKHPDKIHVFQNVENKGVTINFLHAVSRTTMDYVMLCDQDDVWKPHKISLTLKRMRHMEGQFGKDSPLAVFTDAIVVDKDLMVLKDSFFTSNHLDPCRTKLPHILMENKLIGCTVMINSALRKVLQSKRLPSNAKFHDWWLALIAASMGKIGYVNEGTILYRQHGGNVVGGDGFLPYVKNRIVTLRNQREAIIELYRQAEEFLSLYEDELSEESKRMIRVFSQLEQCNFIEKRRVILRYGYLKSGFLRNLGLMIII